MRSVCALIAVATAVRPAVLARRGGRNGSGRTRRRGSVARVSRLGSKGKNDLRAILTGFTPPRPQEVKNGDAARSVSARVAEVAGASATEKTHTPDRGHRPAPRHRH